MLWLASGGFFVQYCCWESCAATESKARRLTTSCFVRQRLHRRLPFGIIITITTRERDIIGEDTADDTGEGFCVDYAIVSRSPSTNCRLPSRTCTPR